QTPHAAMPTVQTSKDAPAKVVPHVEPNPLRATVHVHAGQVPSDKIQPATVKRPTVAAPAPKQRWWLTLLILGVVSAAAYYAYQCVEPYLALRHAPPPPPPPRVIPVVTYTVGRSDMDLYLNGLGTVTSFKTVTVRSRVDGELVKIAFKEGQMVKQGDLIAE